MTATETSEQAPAAAPETTTQTAGTTTETAPATTQAAPAETMPAPSESRIELTPEGVRGVDPATRDALLFGERGGKAEDGGRNTEEDGVTATDTTKPAAETVAEPDRVLPNRINTAQFDAREQEAIALKHELKQLGENITLTEACARVDAKYEGPKTAVSPEGAGAIPGLADTGAGGDPLAAMQAEADALAEQMAAHDDELMGPELRKLQSEHAAKLAEIAAIRAVDKYRAEVGDTQRRSARESAKAQVLADFPTASDDATMLGAEIAKQFLEVRDPAHPDHARFQQDDGPKFLTERAAEAVKARLVATGRFTPEEAMAAIKGKPYAEAKGPAGVPTKTESTAVPRTLAVAAPGNRPAAEAATVDIKTLLETAKADPKLRDAALFGTAGTIIA